MPSTFGLGAVLPRMLWGGGPPPALWNPVDSTPLDVLDAGDAGAIYTTTGKTTLSSYLQAPVGAYVPTVGPAGDWQQATTARRMTLVAMGDQMAFLGDGGDDALGRINNYPSAGAKTLGIRAQYTVALGASDVDVLLVLGGTSRGFQVRIGGASSSAPGISFAADITGPTTSRRCSTWIPTTAVFSLVIVYRGGGNTTTSNYRIWVNGVEQVIDTTGPSMDVSTTSYVLNAGPASSPVTGKFSRLCVVAEDKSASEPDVRGWLEEPMDLLAWTPQSPGDPALWVDPSAANSLWQDTSATTAAASPGDPVARANALTGTNLTQATGTARVTRSTLGSRAALAGDATDDRLASSQTIADAACTVALAYKYSAALTGTTRQTVFVMGVAGSKSLAIHLATATASLPYLSWTLAGAVSTAHVGVDLAVADTAVHVIEIVYLGGTVTDPASWACLIDGVAQTVVTRAAITPSGTTSLLARSNGTTPCGAAVGEVIVWAAALGSADRTAATAYLAGRWT